ncbi:MAG: hypothetical protein HIU84_01195 [Acidobacteria bacterium]|nr:hypothetical protein [Acidobacteriota bacterium]
MLAWLRRHYSTLGLVDAGVILVVIYITVWSLHPSLIFSSSLITGGDTGAHLALPAYLKTTGNIFNLTPWYPGWFAGMPAYTYYFVLPDVLATLASYVINFAVAMKLATILGSVLMPLTAYAMGRLFRAPRPIPAALAIATLPFLFDASFTIDGGNLFSTMAGEYAFSLSLALSLLTIGLFARGVRTGRGYWLAALSLSATLASHVLPWMFAIAATGVLVVFELLARRGLGDPRDRDMVRGDYARPLRFAMGAGLISMALSAWWLTTFVTTQNFTNSMGYTNDNVSTLQQIFAQLGWYVRNPTTGALDPGGDRWVIILAGVAIVVAFIVRDRLGMVLASLTVLSLLAYAFAPQSVLWNERFVPFWFITIHLSAGWLFGYGLSRWVGRNPRRSRGHVELVDVGATQSAPMSDDWSATEGADEGTTASGDAVSDVREHDHVDESVRDSSTAFEDDGLRRERRTVRATVIVALLGLLSTVPGLIPSVATDLHLNTTGNQVSSWAAWNYSGYQGKAAWPEYKNLIDTMTSVSTRYGCGRAMWEYSGSGATNENRFGSPMALMLLPYWTNNCVDSMEGLFFESSPTAPYHFLNQAELSVAPSDPQSGLPYGTLNVFEGVRHLQMLGVKYYIAFSPAAISEANADPALRLVATTQHWPVPDVTWHVYLIKNSPMVQSLTHTPNVVAGVSSRVGWLNANTWWWVTNSAWKVPIAESGPATWPHVASTNAMTTSPTLPRVTVSALKVGTQSLSFHVDRIGVPMLVKISYFPRWHVTGATGPYRVSPNLMVVIPTSNNVTLSYTSTPALLWGNVVSDVAVFAGLVTLWLFFKRRRNLAR